MNELLFCRSIDKDFKGDRRCTCPGFINQMKRDVIGESTGKKAAEKIDKWIEENPDYILKNFVEQLKIERDYFLQED